MLQKILGWILTPLYMATFFLVLIIFHPIQIIGLRFGGYSAHKKVVDMMLFCLIKTLYIMGIGIKFRQLADELPTDKPLILVCNHQNMFDIPLVGWLFRKNHPKYISKVELLYGIPSISYNIRHGGSVAIDRSNPREAILKVIEFGEYLEQNNYAGCIFPEGTRARDGQLLPFKTTGLTQLMKAAPSALIIPIVIDGSWKIMRYKGKPIPFGFTITCTALAPIIRDGRNSEEIIAECEQKIKSILGQ